MRVTVVIKRGIDRMLPVYLSDDLPDFRQNGQGKSVKDSPKETWEAYSEIKKIFAKEDNKA